VAVRNQQMNTSNTPALIRTLIIYAVCVPLAIWIGFMVAGPFDRASFSYVGILLLILLAPILLRWHHLLLIVCWNLGMTVFFLPGRPPLWLLMVALSLGLSVLLRTINDRARFLSAPSITWPLIFFIGVVLMTAKLTGGFGLHSLGNDVAGGSYYVYLLMGLLGYFALTAQRIPSRRTKLYVSLFFLSGCTAFISDLAPFLPHQLYFIYAFFPNYGSDLGLAAQGNIGYEARYSGISWTGEAGFFFMLACYGPRGIFLAGRLWRPVLLAGFFFMLFFGGFRSIIILCTGIFVIQFYLERMHRTRVFPVFIFAGVIGITLLIPFARTLPFAVQRSMAFLPLLKLNPVARRTAEDTQAWRLGIWKDALATVPQYLLLGKGYAITANQLQVASSQAFNRSSDLESVDITGNYHSGPLSTIIPFGIWGVIALLWFWIASLRALWLNHRYGDPALRTVNIFLLACFTARVFQFLIIFGGLYGDMYFFTSLIGLSVSLNGGIRRKAPAPVPVADRQSNTPPARPRFQPFYQS
jgi:hypothetical protein